MKFSKEVKAGAIAILSIVVFVIMFQFMKGKNVFTSDHNFFTILDNVEGLEPSSKVTIGGLKVGQITKIIPITDKNGKIVFLISFTVNKNYNFSKKSTVSIAEPGIMSAKELKLNLDYGKPSAKDGDTLQSVNQLSLMGNLASQVGPVKDQISEVLKRVDSLANSANKVFDEKNRTEITMLLTNLNRTVSGLEKTSQSANALIASNNPKVQKMLDNANVAVSSASSAMNKYGKLADDIDAKQLNSTIANLDATINKLNGLVVRIEKGEGNLGKLTKDEKLYNNLEQTTNSLNELLKDLKENPKKYINISVFGKSNKQ